MSTVAGSWSSPKIIRDGLVLYLDANSPNSYNTFFTPTIWKDLSKNNNAGSLINGPTFNSDNGGNLVFDAIDDYMITSSITNFRTISLWVNYYNTGTAWKYLLDARPGMSSGYYAPPGIGGQWVSQYVNGISTTVSFTNIPFNTWCNLVIIADTNYTSTINFMSRVSNDEVAGGKLGIINIYNRVLTAAEVLQNYNATKSRFGL